MTDYNAVNSIYKEFFGDKPPAREAVEVARLPRDANVEISLIAVKNMNWFGIKGIKFKKALHQKGLFNIQPKERQSNSLNFIRNLIG